MSDLMKKAIKATFLELLEQKPLSQITVKMIVEECGINRNSFYYHYQDLPALIEEIYQEQADAIIESHPTIESIEDALKVSADFASKQRRAILHALDAVGHHLVACAIRELERRSVQDSVDGDKIRFNLVAIGLRGSIDLPTMRERPFGVFYLD